MLYIYYRIISIIYALVNPQTWLRGGTFSPEIDKFFFEDMFTTEFTQVSRGRKCSHVTYKGIKFYSDDGDRLYYHLESMQGVPSRLTVKLLNKKQTKYCLKDKKL